MAVRCAQLAGSKIRQIEDVLRCKDASLAPEDEWQSGQKWDFGARR